MGKKMMMLCLAVRGMQDETNFPILAHARMFDDSVHHIKQQTNKSPLFLNLEAFGWRDVTGV